MLGHHPRIREVTDGKGIEVFTKEVFWLIAEQIWNRITKQIGLHRYAPPAKPIPLKLIAGDVIAVLFGYIQIVLEILDNPGSQAVPGVNHTGANHVDCTFKSLSYPSEGSAAAMRLRRYMGNPDAITKSDNGGPLNRL